MPDKTVEIIEVGPRDGFQNLKQIIPTLRKLEIIDGLISAGMKEIEITSFVSPKAIPQMADAGDLARACVDNYPGVTFCALVPNLRGAQLAWEAGIRRVCYVISLSESHNKANINRSHAQSREELASILEAYPSMEIYVGLATVFGCPFEGIPSIETAVSFVNDLRDRFGVRDFSLADTIGIADPKQIRDTITAMRAAMPDCRWQVHIHDTRNMGMVNTLAAIESGIDCVQSALGGLGGCPFAPGASGNTATEDLVYMLERMGYSTGVDFDKLLLLSKWQKSFVDGIYSGHQININADAPCVRPLDTTSF